MTREFQCKWGCGTLLHYDNGKVVDGSNVRHWCPNYPRSQGPRVLQSFDELENAIDHAVEHIITLANIVSKTTTYAIITRPKDNRETRVRV
jgi:hypothetical protein